MRFIIVDDNNLDLFALQMEFQARGLSVLTFDSIESIWPFIDQRRFQPGDTILIDFSLKSTSLPEFNGDVLVAYLVALIDEQVIPPLKIIGITAHLTEDISESFRDAGASISIEKPINIDLLVLQIPDIKTINTFHSTGRLNKIIKHMFEVTIIPDIAKIRLDYTLDDILSILGVKSSHIRLTPDKKSYGEKLIDDIGSDRQFSRFIELSSRNLSDQQKIILNKLLTDKNKGGLENIMQLANCNSQFKWINFRDQLIKDMQKSLIAIEESNDQ